MDSKDKKCTIPKGWKREEIVRKKGIHKGKIDVYITSPSGKLFRSKKELAKYIDEKKLVYKIEDFNFSVKKTNQNFLLEPPGDIKSVDISTCTDSGSVCTSDDSYSLNSLNSVEIISDLQNDFSIELNVGTPLSTQPIVDFDNHIASSNSTPMHKDSFVVNKLNDIEKNSKIAKEIQTDVNTGHCMSLLNNEWLNDDMIRIYLEMLNDKIVNNENIYFINPVVSQAIKCLDDTDYLITPLKLQEKSFILIPVNDAKAVCAVGGTHWSLLLYQKSRNTFYYLDSSKQYNLESAKEIFLKVSRVITDSPENANFHIVNCPQQDNMVDCGVYLLLFVDHIVKGILNNNIDLALQQFHELKINRTQVISKRATLAYLMYNSQHLFIEAPDVKKLFFEQCMPQTCLTEPTPQVTDIQSTTSTDPKTKEKGFLIRNNNNSQKWEQPKKVSKANPQPKTNLNLNTTTIQTNNRYDVLHHNHGAEYLEDTGRSNNFTSPVQSTAKDKRRSAVPKWIHDRENSTKMEIELYADSHGRQLPEIINFCSKNKIKVSGQVMPGATTEKVYNEAMRSRIRNKMLLLISGSNDVIKKTTNNIYENLEKYLENLIAGDNSKTIIVTTIPHRYDLNPKDSAHDHITMINNYIKEITVRTPCVKVIDLDELERFHFTNHGLHLNHRGKKKLSYMITSLINKIKMNNVTHVIGGDRPVNSNSVNSKSVNSKSVNSNSPRQIRNSAGINIIQANMKDIIDGFQNNETVGFAHTISADLDSERSMSAGVAVAFRNRFGKPLLSNCLSSHLAYQKVNKGASIFSLITKTKYFLKPTKFDYDCAFEQLTNEFKKRQLKILICSAMGCVRDQIWPDHFIQNLIRFQKNTGAIVNIICYYQNSNRLLYNGVPYNYFLKRLQQIIDVYHTQQSSPISELHLESSASVSNGSTLDQRTSPKPTHNSPTSTSNPASPKVTPGDLQFSEVVKLPGSVKKQSSGALESVNSVNIQVPPCQMSLNNSSFL